VRVALWDERFTTKEAEGKLKQRGMKGRARRAVVDKVAAQVLLQAYLDTKRPNK
jgi:putative Holliday junction resolvase